MFSPKKLDEKVVDKRYSSSGSFLLSIVIVVRNPEPFVAALSRFSAANRAWNSYGFARAVRYVYVVLLTDAPLRDMLGQAFL
jgi:hypothetical protein